MGAGKRSKSPDWTSLRRSAQEDLLEARLAAGEHRDVVADAEARVAEEPLRERRWALLALAQYRSGNQGEALRTLRRARQTLITELGLDPGTELVALEAAILGQDPALLTGEQAVASVHCPYQGLAAYDIDDADMFFGRDADVAACLDRLTRVRMLVLAGPSGCGKSSLARAGVAAALRRRGTHGRRGGAGCGSGHRAVGRAGVVPERPRRCRRPAGGGLRRVPGQSGGAGLLRRLAEYAVVARSGDRHHPLRPSRRPGHRADPGTPRRGRVVPAGTAAAGRRCGPLSRDQRQRPGLRLEPGLVELLVREAEDEPGALPLLSHALVQTWERRDGRVLTVEGYLATGEIHGAVARSAEQLYQSLPTARAGPAAGAAVAAGGALGRRRTGPRSPRRQSAVGRQPGARRCSSCWCRPGCSRPTATTSSSPMRRWPRPGPGCGPGSRRTRRPAAGAAPVAGGR